MRLLLATVRADALVGIRSWPIVSPVCLFFDVDICLQGCRETLDASIRNPQQTRIIMVWRAFEGLPREAVCEQDR